MAQTAPESDSDSGMGSPAEELLTETNKKEELQGEATLQHMVIQPDISSCNHRLVTFM